MSQENGTTLENFIPPPPPLPSPFSPHSPLYLPLPPPPSPFLVFLSLLPTSLFLSLLFSSPFSFPPPLTLTHRFIGRLCSIPGEFLQQEHEQLPPLLHAGVEERLVANLTLVAKTLSKERKLRGQTIIEPWELDSSFSASQVLFCVGTRQNTSG